jgi:hypothetical protein
MVGGRQKTEDYDETMTEGGRFLSSAFRRNNPRNPDYWMAAAGDAGVAASVIELSVAVLCQMVPVVLVPK